jgi:methionyl-tRNA formyltransferase
LPKYRGAAPVNWAIVHGELETGVSLMQMDAGLDTGPVLARETLAIGPEETAGELAARIAELASNVVRTYLERAVRGELVPEPQDEARATLAPLIEAKHREVDFRAEAEAVANLVRGMSPAPGAFTTVRGKRLRLGRVRPVPVPPGAASDATAPGTVRVIGGVPYAQTGKGVVEIVSAKLEGKRELSGRDLVNGRALVDGSILGEAAG